MIQVFDNVIGRDLYNELLGTFLTTSTKWKLARTDNNNEDRYLTIHVKGDTYEDGIDQNDDFVYDVVGRLFEHLKNNLSIPEEAELESCYVNGLTHGMEAHPHIDTRNTDKPFTTIIVYLCNHWSVFWGGETVFIDGEFSSNPMDHSSLTAEITKSVLPKRNRIVVFDGKITHAVRRVSSMYPDIRATLMFKLDNCDPSKIHLINDNVKKIHKQRESKCPFGFSKK